MKKSLIQKQIEENIKNIFSTLGNKGDSLMSVIANKSQVVKFADLSAKLEQKNQNSFNNSENVTNIKKAGPDNMTGVVKSKKKISKIANKILLGFMAAAITLLGAFGVAKILKNNNIVDPGTDPIVNVDEDTLSNGLKQVRIDEAIEKPVTNYKTRDEFEIDYQDKLKDLSKLSFDKNSTTNENMYNHETNYFNCVGNDLIMTNSAQFKNEENREFTTKLFVKYELSEHNKDYITSIKYESMELLEALEYIVQKLEANEVCEASLKKQLSTSLDVVGGNIGGMASKEMALYSGSFGTLNVDTDKKTVSFFYIANDFTVYYINDIDVTFDMEDGKITNMKIDESTLDEKLSKAISGDSKTYTGHLNFNINGQNLGI